MSRRDPLGPRSFPPELRERFEPEAVLGRGAMGVVFRARDRELGREVAVKILPRHASPALAQRLEREALALAQVRHPHVLEIFSYGESSLGPYLVEELLRGRDLASCEPGSFDAVAVLLDIAGGLEAVHRAGLLHRDVKPGNLMLEEGGRGVLVDFGLVRDPQREALTRTGDVVGTLVYAAPELLARGECSEAADWYAWGASLFHLVEGRLPFASEELLQVGQGRPRAVRLEKTPPDSPLGRLLRACLATDPGARPASQAAIREMLAASPARRASGQETGGEPGAGSEDAVGTGSPSARPASPWPRRVLGALLVGVAVGSILVVPGDPPPARSGLEKPSPARDRDLLRADQEARVEAVLSDLERWIGVFLDEDGRLLPQEPGGRDGILLLGEDPLLWPARLHHLPTVQGLMEEGGLEGLPADLRRRLDGFLREQGLGPLAEPLADLEARAEARDFSWGRASGAIQEAFRGYRQEVGEDLGPWAREALAAASRVEACWEAAIPELRAQLAALPHFPNLGEPEQEPRKVVEELLMRGQTFDRVRVGTARRLARGERALARFLYASCRAVRESGAGRSAFVLGVDQLLTRFWIRRQEVFLSGSARAVLPLPLLLGAREAGPLEAHLRYLVGSRQGIARRRFLPPRVRPGEAAWVRALIALEEAERGPRAAFLEEACTRDPSGGASERLRLLRNRRRQVEGIARGLATEEVERVLAELSRDFPELTREEASWLEPLATGVEVSLRMVPRSPEVRGGTPARLRGFLAELPGEKPGE